MSLDTAGNLISAGTTTATKFITANKTSTGLANVAGTAHIHVDDSSNNFHLRSVTGGGMYYDSDNHNFRKRDGTAIAIINSTSTTLNNGLIIEGSLTSGGSAASSNYVDGADNIILKGNATGVSGIFFESEKDGTSINHPSDYGFIQYHAYGIGGSTGESNRLVIGVSNDASTDKIVLNPPGTDDLVVRVGTGAVEYPVYYSGNFVAGTNYQVPITRDIVETTLGLYSGKLGHSQALGSTTENYIGYITGVSAFGQVDGALYSGVHDGS